MWGVFERGGCGKWSEVGVYFFLRGCRELLKSCLDHKKCARSKVKIKKLPEDSRKRSAKV